MFYEWIENLERITRNNPSWNINIPIWIAIHQKQFNWSFSDEQRAGLRKKQTRLPDILDYEECLIQEKIRLSHQTEMIGLSDRPDDEIMYEFTTQSGKWIQTWDNRKIQAITEFHCIPDTRFSINYELPEIQAFVDQGLAYPNDRLTQMEKSLLREGREGENEVLIFHEKSSTNFKKPMHLNEENIQAWLECDELDASTLSDSWQKLGFDRKTIIKMIYGYAQAGSEPKVLPGMKATKQVLAFYFEDLADKQVTAPELEPENHELLYNCDTQLNEQLYEYAKQGMLTLGIESDEMTDEDRLEEEEYRGILDEDRDRNIPRLQQYAMHKLYHGREGVPDALLMRINHADRKEIAYLKKMMYPEIRAWGAQKAKLGYLTPAGKSLFWQYINDREKKIAETYYKQAPQEIKDACLNMHEGYHHQAWNALSQFNGEELNMYDWLLSYVRYKEQKHNNLKGDYHE